MLCNDMNSPTPNGLSWRRCCLPRGPGPAGPITIIAPSSTGFSGNWPPASPGGTSRCGMGRGPRCTVASAAGASPACGTACSPRSRPAPMRPGSWTGPSTSSMAPSSGRTSMRPGQRGGPRDGSARAQPGRLLDEGPSPRGRRRQAADPGAHPRPAARSHGVRAVARAGRGATARPRATPAAARPRGRRQGVHRAAVSRVLPAAGHPPHHPAPTAGTAARALRSGDVPLAESGRAADQSVQAVPQSGHPLRQACGQLPHSVDHRRYPALAAQIAFAYRP